MDADFDLDDILDGALDDFDAVEDNPSSAAAPAPPSQAAPPVPAPQPTHNRDQENKDNQPLPGLDSSLEEGLRELLAAANLSQQDGKDGPPPDLKAMFENMDQFQKDMDPEITKGMEALVKFAEQMTLGMANNSAEQPNDSVSSSAASSTQQTASAPSTQQTTSAPSTQQTSSTPNAAPKSVQSSIDEALKGIAESQKDIGNNDDQFANLFGEGGQGMEEMFQKLMGGLDGMGQGDKSSMDAMVEGLMAQMMSKEYLYTPIKEITQKYPKWMEDSKDKVPEEEMKNYRKQYECFQRLCTVFETTNDNAEVMKLMNEMQEYGNPPQEIVGDLLPDLANMGADPNGMPGMPPMDENNPLAGLMAALGEGGSGTGSPQPTSEQEAKMMQDLQNGCPTQ